MGKQFSFTKLNSQKKKFQLEQAVLRCAKRLAKVAYLPYWNDLEEPLFRAVDRLIKFEKEKS